MAKSSSASYLFLLLLSLILDGSLRLVNAQTEQKTWCVAKPSSDEATLLENVKYACTEVDCKILEKDGACYSPDNLINHASIAMNIYYQCKGRNPWNCHFGNSALISLTDPSYGGCKYEYGLGTRN